MRVKNESKSKRNERQRENYIKRGKKISEARKANKESNVKDFEDTTIAWLPRSQPRIASSTIRGHTQDAIFVIGHHLSQIVAGMLSVKID